MNGLIDTKFYEKYIKEIPIEEQIRGRVRAECHYMDKADIYEWITQNEIKIMDLQSKIDKTIKILKYDGIVEDIFYALGMLFEISDYFDDETMIPKELRDILRDDK